MSERPEPLRYVSWRDVFPWLLLLRTFSLSVAASTLLLAVLAVVVIPLGWRFGGLLFLSDEDRLAHAEVVARLERMPGQPAEVLVQASPEPGALRRRESDEPQQIAVHDSPRPDLRLRETLYLAAAAAALLVEPEVGVPVRAYLTFGGLATLLVYGVAGGALTRVAVLRLGRDERAGLGAALSHARARWLAYMLAPLYPLLAVLIIFAGCALLGLMMRVGAGALLATLIWPAALLASAIGAILLLGVVGGGALMWGATASEPDGDVFESISRAFSYVLGRPLNLIAYAAIVIAVGSLGWLAVSYFCQTTVAIAAGGAAWGAAGNGVFGEDPGRLSRLAGKLIGFGNDSVLAIRRAFEFSFFWTAVGGVYLLIRRDVDNTELDEVHSDDGAEKFALPDLTIDASGVPQVAESPTAPETPAPEVKPAVAAATSLDEPPARDNIDRDEEVVAEVDHDPNDNGDSPEGESPNDPSGDAHKPGAD